MCAASGHQTVTARAGLAYASSVQAVVQAGGWSYEVPLDVPWIDSTGTEHEGGSPSCLPAFEQTLIDFGAVSITVAGGASQRSVVWVRCP